MAFEIEEPIERREHTVLLHRGTGQNCMTTKMKYGSKVRHSQACIHHALNMIPQNTISKLQNDVQ